MTEKLIEVMPGETREHLRLRREAMRETRLATIALEAADKAEADSAVRRSYLLEEKVPAHLQRAQALMSEYAALALDDQKPKHER